MRTTVIHHSADYDGIFCREIARKFLPDAELIGWDFGDAKLQFPTEGDVYVMDLSPDCFAEVPAKTERIIWIDHHKSSIEKFSTGINGYRIDGVAACRLAWQWFLIDSGRHDGEIRTNIKGVEVVNFSLPDKQEFIDREVGEPLAVQLVGEYDVWDHAKSDGDDIAFQFGLDAQHRIEWDWILQEGDDCAPYIRSIIGDGRAAMRCYAKRDADVMRSRSFLADFEGLKFLCVNTARCNSNTFAARDVPGTGHDALLAFYFTGKDYSFSLYHAAHRKDIDLSQIAVKYGGGGHRGACGFRMNTLPFPTS